ncbi:Hypothetical predicted protein [Marmota monax]|uniref:Uncharacterized protein n=1 Tax=Marmota monax TaxID=9995 RepID=A0A5E4CWC5_MARMO|nr:hypothetical protein GHT09_008972 [Marmota monax]VTJ86045.1 Hypothetical predicted protein [Marmota monax]
MEDQEHQVPALTENPELMEEEAEAAGPPPVLGDAPAQIPPPPPPEIELELEGPVQDCRAFSSFSSLLMCVILNEKEHSETLGRPTCPASHH